MSASLSLSPPLPLYLFPSLSPSTYRAPGVSRVVAALACVPSRSRRRGKPTGGWSCLRPAAPTVKDQAARWVSHALYRGPKTFSRGRGCSFLSVIGGNLGCSWFTSPARHGTPRWCRGRRYFFWPVPRTHFDDNVVDTYLSGRVPHGAGVGSNRMSATPTTALVKADISARLFVA